MTIKFEKLEKKSVSSPMWTVFASKFLFSLIGIALVFFYFAPLLASLLYSLSIPIPVSYYIICISISMYALFKFIKTIKEDNPSHWKQEVEIDFKKKELTLNPHYAIELRNEI